MLGQQDGVLKTEVGYSGGDQKNPSYEAVCQGNTGHLEVARIIYDPSRIDYEQLCRLFFEIHDPTQVDGQGPDIGDQYRSVIFYINDDQKKIAEKIKNILIEKGVDVVTKIQPLDQFYAEQDPAHQKYYFKNNKLPYCHIYQKKF